MILTAIISVAGFLLTSFVGTLETKAANNEKHSNTRAMFRKLETNQKLMLCYMDKKHCFKVKED